MTKYSQIQQEVGMGDTLSRDAKEASGYKLEFKKLDMASALLSRTERDLGKSMLLPPDLPQHSSLLS
jgi:hypothetical protein